MRSVPKLALLASTLVASAMDLAQADSIQAISQHQADMLLAVLQEKAAPLSLSGQMQPLPPGELDPIVATTGIHCVLPGANELYFSVRYIVGMGVVARRTIFAFTVSPAKPFERGSTDIARLLNGRTVTQYWVWHASRPPGQERPTDSGVVVDFVSRTPSACVPP